MSEIPTYPDEVPQRAEVKQPVEFKDFGKISRFRTLTALVTEKVDGTNAQIYVPADPSEPLLYGSRNQWVTSEKDNMGFARFVHEHADMFRRLGPGRHFAEWYGAGIQRRYGLDHKRLMIFNVDRFEGGLPGGFADTFGDRVHLAPVLYRGPVDTNAIQAAIDKLYAEGSVAVPGWKQPEGVIVQIAGSRWKVTDNGDVHKGQTWTHQEVVQAAARKYRTEREATETAFDRALRRVKVERDPGDGKAPFWVSAQSGGGVVVDVGCSQPEIAATRRAVATRIVALEGGS